MSEYGASEPVSGGSDEEEDNGPHVAERRVWWREQRKAIPSGVDCPHPHAAAEKPSVTKAVAVGGSGNAVWALCMRRLPALPVRCRRCAGIIDAMYCSKKCLSADASRHRDECTAVVEDPEVKSFVKMFRSAPKIPDDAAEFTVGAHPEKCVHVQREIPPVSVPALVPASADPIADWKQQYGDASLVCCRPWVSFGSPSAVVVSWLSPVADGRYPTVRFELQMRSRPSALAEPTEWVACAEAHTGQVPSHVVNGLTCGEWVEFRVRQCDRPSVLCDATPEACADRDFSEPSVPFRVGYAEFTAVVPLVGKRSAPLPLSDFTSEEIAFFKTLRSPAQVQDYLDTVPMNHEIQDDTCLSALESVRQNCAHCIEGAMLGAYILSLNGHPPYVMDIRACEADDDHIVTPFKVGRRWGCLSVSNHASLRFRNPVYRTLREMVMSYFDDYMNGKGERTLRAYSNPIHLGLVFGPRWSNCRGDVYEIAEFVDTVKHYRLVEDSMIRHLRPADEMVLATTVHQREWQAPDNFDEEQVRRNENK